MIQKVIAILSEVKNDPSLAEKVNESIDIVNGVGLDSLQMINFILRIEDEFKVEIDFEGFDFSYMSSVKAFCEYLSKTTQG